jgi:hypothetical protein
MDSNIASLFSAVSREVVRIYSTDLPVSLVVRTRLGKELKIDLPDCLPPVEDVPTTTATKLSARCVLDILQTLSELERRLTTTDLIREMTSRQRLWGESTIKGQLAEMVRIGLLNNMADEQGKGYGIPV